MSEPLQFEYDRHMDVLTIEGNRYTGELFRALGGGLATDRWFKIMSRQNGVITIFSPPEGHVCDACKATINGLKTSLKAVTTAVYQGARREMVKASDAAELLLLVPSEVPDCKEPCCTIDKPLRKG